MMSTGTVIVTLEQVAEIADNGLTEIAQNLAHQMLDTRMSTAMHEARNSGCTKIFSGNERNELECIFGPYSLLGAITRHLYPTDEEFFTLEWPYDGSTAWLVRMIHS